MPAKNPLVSIVIPCFNAKKTVKETLDSIAMQKTNFEVQVLLGDDCSTDGTQDYLRSIQDQYPEGFEFYLRPQNMGERGNKNCQDLMHRCRGKYMAIVEADDFWTYDGKLQAQVDFLAPSPTARSTRSAPRTSTTGTSSSIAACPARRAPPSAATRSTPRRATTSPTCSSTTSMPQTVATPSSC